MSKYLGAQIIPKLKESMAKQIDDVVGDINRVLSEIVSGGGVSNE